MEFQLPPDHSHWSDFILDSNSATPTLEKATIFSVTSVASTTFFDSVRERLYLLSSLKSTSKGDHQTNHFDLQDRYCSSEEELSPMEEDDQHSEVSSFHSFDPNERVSIDSQDSEFRRSVQAAVRTAMPARVVKPGEVKLITIPPRKQLASTNPPSVVAGPSKSSSQHIVSNDSTPLTSPSLVDDSSVKMSLDTSRYENTKPAAQEFMGNSAKIDDKFQFPARPDLRTDRKMSASSPVMESPATSRFALRRRSSLFGSDSASIISNKSTSGNRVTSMHAPSPSDGAEVPKSRSERFRSMYRSGKLNIVDKRESLEPLRSASAASMYSLIRSPSTMPQLGLETIPQEDNTLPQYARPPPPSSSMFGPSPSVRPLASRAVARAADERRSISDVTTAFKHGRADSEIVEKVSRERKAADEERLRAEAAARAKRLVSMATSKKTAAKPKPSS